MSTFRISPDAARKWLLLVALVPCAYLIGAQWSIPPLAEAGDYAHYLLHALALAEGRPYGDTGYLYTPLSPWVGPPLQPPVWPAILAPFVGAFGPLSLAPKVVTLVALALLLFLTARYFLGREGYLVAAIVLLLLGVTLERQYVLSAPLADIPFACLVWLLIGEGDADKPWTWRRLLWLNLIIALACGTRAAGAALFPALLLGAIWRSPAERRRAAMLFAVALVLSVLLLAWRRDAVPFLSMLAARPLAGVLEAVRSAATYKFALFDATGYPTPFDAFNDAYHLLIAPIIILGFLVFSSKYHKSLLFSVVLCYSLMLVVVPVRSARYTWPLWPALLCIYALGLSRFLSILRVGARRQQATVMCFMVLVATGASVTAASRPTPQSLVDRRETRELFSWLREQPDHRSFRVVFESPRIMPLYTGIPAMSPFRATAEITRHELDEQGITHAILGGGVASRKVLTFADTLRALRPQWSVVFRNREYEVLARPVSP